MDNYLNALLCAQAATFGLYCNRPDGGVHIAQCRRLLLLFLRRVKRNSGMTPTSHKAC